MPFAIFAATGRGTIPVSSSMTMEAWLMLVEELDRAAAAAEDFVDVQFGHWGRERR